MTSALEVTGLTYAHTGAEWPTIDRVDVRVQTGAMTAVVGPSGSGKTTVLRLVAGLLTPDAGAVTVGGRSVLGLPPERRGMTMMFQKPHLFPHLSVLDNVAFAARVAGVSKAAARESAQRYLSLVHLGDLARRRPRELSGGQEQRVALARALAAEPEVLLLDEPFSSLDAELRASMHGLLGEVRAALGPTIVMVTHDMAEAALADRVAVLVQGRVVQDDALADLYLAPASLDVARVLGGFSEVTGTLEAGRHHSALGTLSARTGRDLQGPAPPPAAGTLLLRQESVLVLPRGAGAGASAGAGAGVPAGAGRGTTPTPPGASAHAHLAAGTVSGISWVGARQLATVSIADSASTVVRGEVPLGRTVRLGEPVRLVIEPDPWCLVDPDVSGAGAVGAAEPAVPRDAATRS